MCKEGREWTSTIPLTTICLSLESESLERLGKYKVTEMILINIDVVRLDKERNYQVLGYQWNRVVCSLILQRITVIYSNQSNGTS